MLSRTSFLQTNQVDLVHLTQTDAVTVLPWLNDHAITQYLARGDRPLILTEEESYLSTLYDKKDKLVLGIWHKAAQRLIGMSGLHEIDSINQTAVFGIVIGDRSLHRKGVGTEVVIAMCEHAFAWLNLRNVTLRVLGNNPQARKCYEKVGFVKCGCFHSHVFKNGVWVDEIIMRITRERFRRKKKTTGSPAP